MRVYLDFDGNGVRGPLEPTTLTDASGAYSFAGVDSASSARVRQELTFGWSSSAAVDFGNFR